MKAKLNKGIYFFMFVALFANLIANEKPLYCKIKGEICFPAFQEWFSDFGFVQKNSYGIMDWQQCADCQDIIKTAIPYSVPTMDYRDTPLVNPLRVKSAHHWRERHWLGTDGNRHDIFAGIISGTRIAFLIGVGATSIAVFFGMFFGVFSTFFGNDKIKLSWASIVFFMMSIFYIFFIATQMPFGKAIFTFLISHFFLFFLIDIFEKKIGYRLQKFAIPLESFVFRGIDTIRSIPSLLLILSFMAIAGKKNELTLSLIIGSLTWFGVAILVRAEVLKVKNSDYIQAAKSMGFGNFQIIKNHVLPNIWTPVLVLFGHLVTVSIIAESSLSFLGIGLSDDKSSWGSILRQGQSNTAAWWLAVFPGLCLFGVIVLFNRWAEELRAKNH